MELAAAAASRSLLSSQLTTSYLSDTSTSGHYFDIKAKSDIILNGIDINSAQDVGTNSPIEIYVKSGSYEGYTNNSTRWLIWANRLLTNTSGVDAPTSISIPPININTDGKRSFYIHCTANNDCLRYDSTSHNTTLRVYQNQHVMLYREGITKVNGDTWSGELSDSPSVFSGGLSYDVVTQSPTKMPTLRPSKSPSQSPTLKPTESPSTSPTPAPSYTPSLSPVVTETISTNFNSTHSYTGIMWNVQTRGLQVVLTSMAFNTNKIQSFLSKLIQPSDNVNVKLYMRDGSYVGHDKSLDGWTLITNTTVASEGLDNPTYLPLDEPIILNKYTLSSFYLTSDGPVIRVSKGIGTGNNQWGVATASSPPEETSWNTDLIIYEGIGKSSSDLSLSGTFAPRVWNGLFEYHTVTEAPTRYPTARPTVSPTTAMPTMNDFRLRLYWEYGYYWQDQWDEMWWCMQCGSSGRPCQPGDYVYVEWCRSTLRQKWNSVGDTLRPLTNPNLCMTVSGYNTNRPLRLYECKDDYNKQQFDGFSPYGRFELFPKGDDVNCLSQQHHPSSYEGVYPENCALSRRYQTSSWVVF